MATRSLKIVYDTLPGLLKPFVDGACGCTSDGDDDVPRTEPPDRPPSQPSRIVGEQEYYTAFENLLRHWCYGGGSADDDGPNASPTPPRRLSDEQDRELVRFHLNTRASSWVYDHDAHRRYAYYPSNAFPLGSAAEYSFFMRQWTRNVNRPQVKRIYERNGDFKTLLRAVDETVCPCRFLVVFNALNLLEYRATGERPSEEDDDDADDELCLCRITVENELMMRSEFFNKRKVTYPTFNRWFYDKFLKPRHKVSEDLEKMFASRKQRERARNNLVSSRRRAGKSGTSAFYRHLRYDSQAAAAASSLSRKRSVPRVETAATTTTTSSSAKDKRLREAEEVSRRLLFGSPVCGGSTKTKRETATVETGVVVNADDGKLLVRCEDYTSPLYSPALKIGSCRHDEESVRYEQRRCGDEIRTEIRTCKKCGADDVAYEILKGYGVICREEKFTVLPYDVRLLVARTVDRWVKEDTRTRLCVADPLVGALTLMAHGTHQIYNSFDRFLDCDFDRGDKLLKCLRCYKNCVPEPGTYFGEIVAQFFQHCKQQSNLNVKRTTRGGGGGGAEDGRRPEKRAKSDLDKKFEVIMSLKRVATVVLVFRCLQTITRTPSWTEADLVNYLRRKVFGTYARVDGAHLLDKTPHDFSVKQFENADGGEIYFSLTLYRSQKYDALLDETFKCVDAYNGSMTAAKGVKHRLSACSLVYCSDTLYFLDMSQSLFIDNSVTFLYCFLTEKFRPVVETKEDSFVFGLVKILSAIEYFTQCSLKKSQTGHGPLTSVISEGGLNVSTRYVNNLLRDSFAFTHQTTGGGERETTQTTAADDGHNAWPRSPKSPVYAPDSSPDAAVSPVPHNKNRLGTENNDTPTGADTGNGVVDRRYYVINEPYINTFLNRPAECGSMY